MKTLLGIAVISLIFLSIPAQVLSWERHGYRHHRHDQHHYYPYEKHCYRYYPYHSVRYYYPAERVIRNYYYDDGEYYSTYTTYSDDVVETVYY